MHTQPFNGERSWGTLWGYCVLVQHSVVQNIWNSTFKYTQAKLLMYKEEAGSRRQMEPAFIQAVQLLPCCCNLRQKTKELVSSACTKTTPKDLIAPCLKHDNFAVLHQLSPLMARCLVHPLVPALFSTDNPRLPSCCLTPISISHCHPLHHSTMLYLHLLSSIY